MLRKIVDYNKLTDNILNLLVEKFPNGYYDRHIISFRNAQNEIIEAEEVRTDDAIYLVKIGRKLAEAMEDFADNNYDDFDEEINTLDEELE